MAQTIKLKRSAQSGASGIPSTSDLALGEVGINTYHGKMYIKKDDGTESIVEVGDTSGYLPLSGGTLTGNLSLGTNNKAIFNSQLEIYGDGSNSNIKDTSSGNLNISGNDIQILNAASNEAMAYFAQDGDVTLYHNGSPKIATASSGISVTGSVVADGLTVDGSSAFNATATFSDGSEARFGASNNMGLFYSSGTSHIRVNSGIFKLRADDMRFTAQNGTTDKMTLSSSNNVNIPNGSLMVGSTTAPDTALHVESANDTVGIFESTDATSKIQFKDNSSTYGASIGTTDENFFIQANGGTRLTIDSSGNLLVGKTSLDFGATAGQEFRTDGRVFIGSTDGAFVNRIGSDGSIIGFRRDGTGVGSIGTRASQLSIGSADTGLEFNNANDNVLPHNTSTNGGRDAAIDLGASGTRFKDLYLSGKIWTNTATGLSITANSSNRGILNLSTSQAYQLIGGGYYGYTGYKTGGYHRWFGSDGSEDMRLSGGNLLVGTTDTTLWNDNADNYGHNILSNGQYYSSTNGEINAYLNRQNSDGAILAFAQNGTNVGAVSTWGGELAVGRLNCALLFDDDNNHITPHSVNSDLNRDAAIDLGDTTSRFKDLYLSGTANSYRAHIKTASSGASADVSADELVVESNGNTGISILSGQSNSGSIYFGDAGVNYDGYIAYSQPTRSMTFGTAAGSRMTIDSSGTTTFTKSGGGNIRIAETASRYVEIMGYAEGSANGSTMAFHTIQAGTSTSTERARLTSSGDLLVGKTSSAFGTAGVQASASNGLWSTRSNFPPLALNRLSSDGSIVDFYKDGTTVGSIGTTGGQSYIHGAGTDVGLFWGSNNIYPYRSTGLNDATIDLGQSGKRFKDLYLSGHIHMFGNDNQINGGNALYLDSDNTAFRLNNETEIMRFSGTNVLVGKTAVDFGTVGAEILSTGVIRSAVGGGHCLMVNRKDSDGEIINFRKDSTTVGSIGSNSAGGVPVLDIATHPTSGIMRMLTSGTERVRIGSTGIITVSGDGSSASEIDSNTVGSNVFLDLGGYTGTPSVARGIRLFTNNASGSKTERTRIASNGTLYHGKTADSLNTGGLQTLISGQTSITQSYTEPLRLNRMSTEGAIQKFYYNGGEVGSVGTANGDLHIDGKASHSGVRFQAGSLLPRLNGADTDNTIDLGYDDGTDTHRFKDLYLSGKIYGSTLGIGDAGIQADQYNNAVKPFRPDITSGTSDNYLDLGTSSVRWVDIYATNGTIQTSDQNEKQDIESLTEAEERVAIAAKGLLKKFRWKSAVEDKGDDARIHFGIIAQDLQDAFEAEGLDAGRYGMFTSNTWTNEDGEEQTRMGVRYSELLAFIISAI